MPRLLPGCVRAADGAAPAADGLGRPPAVAVSMKSGRRRGRRSRRQAASGRYWTASICFRRSAYWAPYLSRTPWVASMNGVLSTLSMICDAGGPEIGERLLLLRRPQLTLLDDAERRGLADQLLVDRRQGVPDLLREDEDLRHHQVLVERVVVGHLVVLALVIGRRVVLGAVDDAGLQRGVELVVGDLHAVAAHGVDHVDEHRILHDADLHAGEVARASRSACP